MRPKEIAVYVQCWDAWKKADDAVKAVVARPGYGAYQNWRQEATRVSPDGSRPASFFGGVAGGCPADLHEALLDWCDKHEKVLDAREGLRLLHPWRRFHAGVLKRPTPPRRYP